METIAFKEALQQVISVCPPALIAVFAIIILAFWLSWRVNRVISEALNKETEQTLKIAKLEKQQGKLIHMLSAAPCVTKNNGLWLQDSQRNGGQPPEQIKCIYISAKEKVL